MMNRTLFGKSGFMVAALAMTAFLTVPQGIAQATESSGIPHVAMDVMAPAAPVNWEAVSFVNTKQGYLAGLGAIAVTSDGGVHWRRVYHGDVSLQGIAARAGGPVAAWGNNTLLLSYDQGRYWRSVQAPARGGWDSVEFVSRDVGFALVGNTYSNHSHVYLTADGGRRWFLMDTPVRPNGMGFYDAEHGFVIGAASRYIYETSDGGKRWTRSVKLAPEGNINGARIVPTGPHSAWAMLYGDAGMSQNSYTVLHTEDGVHWSPSLAVSTAGGGPAPGVSAEQKVTVGPGIDAGPMAVVSDGTVYVAGGCSACGEGTITIAKTTDAGRAWNIPKPLPGANGYPGPYTMSFANAQDGWLLETGGHSQLLRTTDGGRRWQEVYPSAKPNPEMGFTMVTAKLGYGLGVPGNADAVLRTTDGGVSWQQIGALPVKRAKPYEGSVNPWVISFLTTKHGFAVGSDGRLYVTSTSGARWVALASEPASSQGFSGIAFVDQGAVGVLSSAYFGDAQWVTTDGGRTWRKSAASTPGLALAAAVNGRFHGKLMATATNNRVNWVGVAGAQAWMPAGDGEGYLMTMNSGRSWTEYTTPRTWYGTFQEVDFLNAHDGWMTDWTTNRLYKTVDGGRIWRYISG